MLVLTVVRHKNKKGPLMNTTELPTNLPDKADYQELIDGAETRDDIVALREMARQDLGVMAGTEVLGIGSKKFAELHRVSDEELANVVGVDSNSWRTEGK